MTRHFRWLEQGEPGEPGTPEPEPVECTATDDEIIANYFPHWCDLMRQAGKGDLISHEACLEDFMTVHWAQEFYPHRLTD